MPDPNRAEAEDALLQRALALHPEDADLKTAAASGQFESRFRA